MPPDFTALYKMLFCCCCCCSYCCYYYYNYYRITVEDNWHTDDINVICELLAVKHDDMELDLFSNSVLDAFIEFSCTK